MNYECQSALEEVKNTWKMGVVRDMISARIMSDLKRGDGGIRGVEMMKTSCSKPFVVESVVNEVIGIMAMMMTC